MRSHIKKSHPENNSPFNMIFYYGIVEDNNDPLMLGRCRVRVFGIHDESRVKDTWKGIPTEDLPWAPLMMPPTNAVGGIGDSPTGILPGTEVVLIFRDKGFQAPFILGVVPSISVNGPPTPTSGFGDVKGEYPLRPTVGESDVNRLARGEKLNDTTISAQESHSIRANPIAGQEGDIPPKPSDSGTGKTGGSRSWRNNNPGNMVPNALARQFGSTSSDGTYAIFPTEEDGIKAHKALLVSGTTGKGPYNNPGDYGKGKPYRDKTLDQAVTTWAPNYDTKTPTKILNDTNAYIKFMHKETGISSNDTRTMGQFSPEEIDRIQKAQQKHEGWIIGTMGPTPPTAADTHPPTSGVWGEPIVQNSPQYPFNKVNASLSGHTKVVDDTPGNERLREQHRTGTFYEVQPDGTKVTKVVGDNFSIYLVNNNMFVQGQLNITVLGDASVSCKNANLTATENINSRGKNINFQAEENINFYAKQNINSTSLQTTNFYSKGNHTVKTEGKLEQQADGDVVIAGDNVGVSASSDATLISGGITYIDGGSSIQMEQGTPPSLATVTEPLVTFSAPLPDINDDPNFAEYINQAGDNRLSAYTGDSHALDDDNGVADVTIDNNGNSSETEERLKLDSTGKVILDNNGAPVTETVPVVSRVPADPNNIENTSDVKMSPISSSSAGPAGTIDWNNRGLYKTLQLSPNFNLADLTINTFMEKVKIVSQNGLTEQNIADNLKALAVNILEPLLAKYPGFRINSGFRYGSGKSQHMRGMAADLQFPGYTCKQILEIATWCHANLPTDQIILEHGNGLWLHLSHNAMTGKQRKMDLTWKKGYYSAKIGREYRPGFELLLPSTQLSAGNAAGEKLHGVAATALV